MRPSVKQYQHAGDDPYVSVRQQPVPQRPPALGVNLPPDRIGHHRRNTNEANNPSDPSHVQKTVNAFAQTITLKPVDSRSRRSQRKHYAGQMDQPLWRIGLVYVAPVGVGFIDEQKPLDLSDFGEILARFYASERAGGAVLLAAVSASLGTRRV